MIPQSESESNSTRLVFKIDYDGSVFCGWQKQPGHSSVQSVLEEKLQILTRQSQVEITGCGRTDTGVHARRYFAHTDLDDLGLQSLKISSLNALLPPEIAVSHIWQDPLHRFHSRFDAHMRKYVYRIHRIKDPFARKYSFEYHHLLHEHLDHFEDFSQQLIKINDFGSFVKSNSGLENYNCTLYECRWQVADQDHFEFHIAANRFVRGMVRLIVGAFLQLAQGKTNPNELMEQILSSKQIKHSWSVPANGLTLEEVKYPDDIISRLVDLGI